jgi:anti-sigma regulatory factor (Ser/Thr protein kinase)
MEAERELRAAPRAAKKVRLKAPHLRRSKLKLVLVAVSRFPPGASPAHPSLVTPAALEIHPQNSISSISEAIEKVVLFLRARKVSPHALFVAELSLEELLTNVMKYSHLDAEPHVTRVCVEDDGAGEVTLRVEDDGVAFDPWAAPEPRREIPVLERTPGGQGIMLIKKFAVRCGYERQAEKNCVEVQIARNAEG